MFIVRPKLGPQRTHQQALVVMGRRFRGDDIETLRVRATRWLGGMLRSSKWFAEKFRIFQAVSPGQLDCLGDADPQTGDDIRFARAGMQCDWENIERPAVMLIANPERFRQLARTRAQRSLVMQSAPATHRRNAVGRLQRADQRRARGAVLLADEIDAPVDAVGAI